MRSVSSLHPAAAAWALLLASCAVDAPSSQPPASPSGPVDTFADHPEDPARTADVLARARALVRPGTTVQMESRLGVPTLLWARTTPAVVARARSLAAAGAHPELAAARAALADYAPLYGLTTADVAGAVVASVNDPGPRRGAIVVKYRAQLGGIEIFREELNVVMNRKLEAVALTGYLTNTTSPPVGVAGLAFQIGARAAAALAIDRTTGGTAGTAVTDAVLTAAGSHGGYDHFGVSPASGVRLDEPVRVKPVYFHAASGLEPAYYVEVIAQAALPSDALSVTGTAPGSSDGHAYVISAATGETLFHHRLQADAVDPAAFAPLATDAAFTYRVWADPDTGVPFDGPAGNDAQPKLSPVPDGVQAAFVPPRDVTLSSFPFSKADPWLPPGSTETVGNNTDAFLNLYDPDGYGDPTTTIPSDPPTGDFRAQLTAAGQFLHSQTPDVDTGTAEGRQGAIQQLFYNVNFLHDWYYDAGFDEAAGNAQADNYGRGGIDGDSIKAQSQDSSGFSNANMLTPADGGRPRMRMYTFPSLSNVFEVTAPASIAARTAYGVSMLGPTSYDITADVAIVNFSTATGCAVLNADELAGKLAMFDYDKTTGTPCTWQTLLTVIAQTTTARATVMVYASTLPNSISTIFGFVPADTEPMLLIAWNTALPIKAQLAAGQPVTVHVLRAADRDGSIDQGVVFHEFFHYVSNRLIGNASGLGNNQGGGMGEGWSDFNSMLLMVRASDTLVPSNASFNGTYAMGSYVTSGAPFTGAANQGYYFGIRRYPYSTDLAKNPLTFKHVTNGVALPVGPPVAFGGNGASNAEVHNTGEVWALMLWECYAGLLRDTLGPAPRLAFADAQDRMKRYLIAALKATPVNPTILEARDALLAVALAADPADYVAFRAAFAKRGAGARAIAADRFSATNAGVVEDFTTGPDVMLLGATVDDSVDSCDRDGVLDHGEYGRVAITLQNTGTAALSATTATIQSSDPDLWYPDGPTVAFPPIALGATATASVRVAYAATVTGSRPLDLEIEYGDAQMAAPQTAILDVRANTDDLAATSATETVEAASSAMTVGSNPSLTDPSPWRRAEQASPLSHAWHADDPGVASDEYLISPPLTVDATGTVGIAFDHRWSFEALTTIWFPDGGVVEMSVNSGDYVDIGTPAYNGVLTTYGGDPNPIRGRAAFRGSSAGTVHTVLSQSVAPGSSVRVRFRSASDALTLGTAGTGWTIDNLAFTGVLETPFATVVEDTKACTKVPSDADLAIEVSDGASAIHAGGSVAYTITARNASDGDVLAATVTAQFPPEIACTWTCAASPGAACAASGSGDIADRVALPAGGTATYTALCAVSRDLASAQLSTTAAIAAVGPVADPAPDNNTATDTDTVIRLPAHLTADKVVSGDFRPGGSVVYLITLGNDGAGRQFDNAGDEMIDVLPDGLRLVGAFANAGTALATPDTRTVTWNGAIAPGATVTVAIVAQIVAPAGTAISNQATAHYDSDGDASNDASATSDAYACSAAP